MTVDALRDAYRLGREAWPSLALPEPALRGFIVERVGASEVSVDDIAPLALTDMYLACACIHRIEGAHAAFEAMCAPTVDAALARIGARPVADDIKQQVMDLLFVGKGGRGALGKYSGRGNLRGWVRVIAVREAVRLLKKSNDTVSVGDDAMFDALAPSERDDPELEYLKLHYRDAFRRAFLHAVNQLPRRERTALRMSVLDGLSIDEIGKAFSVHRATAARWLNQAREQLIEGTKAALSEQLRISASEVDSVIRLVRSSLDVSLGGALRSRISDGG